MVTKKEVQHVADLAKLEFSSEELEALTSELNNVLGYIDQLKELEVTNVAPLENLNEAAGEAALRPDDVRPSLAVEAALRNAPTAADGYFLVPKVLAQDIKSYREHDIVGGEEDEL